MTVPSGARLEGQVVTVGRSCTMAAGWVHDFGGKSHAGNLTAENRAGGYFN
jgi:hypothetical protein